MAHPAHPAHPAVPRGKAKPNHNSILHQASCKCIFNEANARARGGEASVNITDYLISLIRHVVQAHRLPSLSVCLPARHCFITKSLCKSFDLSGDSSSRTTVAAAAAGRRLSSLAALLEMQKELGCSREEQANNFAVRELIADRLITNLSLRLSLSLSLEINSKELEHHQSICDTAWRDIVYFLFAILYARN